MRRYITTGFIPINEPPARRTMLAATVEIAKGDALQDNASGYATNAASSFTALFFGIAAAALDNSPAVSGAKVEYYPFDTKTQYMVAVGNDSVLDQADIGNTVDLHTLNTIDIADEETEGIAFRIDAIDISTEAIAANTYGFAIGHFVVVGTQA